MRAFGEQVVAFDVDIAFGALALFFFFLLFDGQKHFDIDHLVKVPGDPVKLPRDVLTQCRGHFQMVPADG
jgi:hypothetical protein